VSNFSEIDFVPIKPQNGLIGFASVIFMDSIYLGSIGVHTRLDGGVRLLFPQNRGINTFYPISKAIGLELEQRVYRKYKELIP